MRPIVEYLAWSLLGVIWILVPFLDRSPGRGSRVSLALTLAGWAALAYMAVMTVFAYLPAGG